MIARREFVLGAAAAGVLMQPRFCDAKASLNAVFALFYWLGDRPIIT
jgi:hypothetical protein